MSHDELTKALWEMPVSERLAMLTCSIVQRNPDVPASIRAMVLITGVMACGLSRTKRFQLAEKMRDTADALERARQLV